MGFLDPRCQACKRKRNDVGTYGTGASSMKLCTRCRKAMRTADRGATPTERTGVKVEPKIAGPMGVGYRGQPPKLQRRK